MNSILKYLQEFYYKEVKLFYFIIVLVMLGCIIYLNYGYQPGMQAASESNWGGRFVYYWLLYLIPFALAFLFQHLFYKDITWQKNFWFWIILILAPAFFALRVTFNWHQPFIKNYWDGDEQIFWEKSLDFVVKVFVLLLPVFIIWLLKDGKSQPFYGARKIDNPRPYLLALLVMLPLVLWACTQNDFMQTYPRAGFIGHLQLSPKKWYYLIYEMCYGFNFISIEFFFRGFLILSLAKICGPRCIIPVACFYCAIHFGKPMGEAISSFWGAMFLGIISYNTRSIWGGLIIHLGLAWMMECCAWLFV